MACMAEEKETQRKRAIQKVRKEERAEDRFHNNGAIMLEEASKTILMKWYSTAKENVFGVDGRLRNRVPLDDVSDDDAEDLSFRWVNTPLEVSGRTAFIATYWLRSARARIQRAQPTG